VNDVCNVQHKYEKARAFKGKQSTTGGVDLMIVDIPVATQDRVFPYYVPNSSIKHSKSDSKDRSQEIL
jgi:hypothetical protein